MDAVKELADAAGIEVPAPDPQVAREGRAGRRLYDVMEAAPAGSRSSSAASKAPSARLSRQTRHHRGHPPRFGFGFAPDSRGKLKVALKDFGAEKLVEAGLLIAPEDQASPMTASAAASPSRSATARGRVIAFSARILGAGEPKYLNSPETPLFDKGRTLFNFDKAAPASREASGSSSSKARWT